MIPLYKFPKPGVDRERVRQESFAQQHVAGHGAEDFARQDFWPLMRRYLRQDKTYVDVQSGTGGWVIFLHDEGYHVEGVDSARRVAQAIAEYEPEIPMSVAPPTKLPYPDESVDGIVAIGALESLEGQALEALREWRRVLREDGTLFFQVPSASRLRRTAYLPLKRVEYALKTAAGQTPLFTAYLFAPGELARLVRKADFAIIELVPHELPDPDAHFALSHDWPFLCARPAKFEERSGANPVRPPRKAGGSAAGHQYRLNALGQTVKNMCNAISPWFASSGLFAIAKALPRSGGQRGA